MTPHDAVGFRDCIAALFASFRAEATQATYRGYWMGLSDLRLQDLQRAVARAIRECRAVPNPIELRRLAGEVDLATRAELAWHAVSSAFPLGPYKHLDFADGIVNAAIRQMGGWPTLLNRVADGAEEKWAKQEFCRVYQRFSEAGVNGEMCAALPGLGEVVIVSGSQQAAQPKRIECEYQHDGAKANRRISGRQQRILSR